MVACTALGADPTTGHTAFDHSVINLNGNNVVNSDTLCFQGLSLGQRAGHAVQDETVRTVGLGHPVSDDAENQLVGNQGAFVHILFCLFTKLRTIGDCLTEHIPG